MDTWRDGTLRDYVDVEVSTRNPQGKDMEGAVCASLWDIFDYQNDSDAWNNDWNAGYWWQRINEIWHTVCEPGDLGHFPYTICDFGHIWSWKGYPTNNIWQEIFVAHGIGVGCIPIGVPDGLACTGSTTPFLWPGHPNPFNPLTQIAFRVGTPGVVSLRVFNTSGQLVRTLLESYKDAGAYTVSWDGKDGSGRELASGVYFCHLAVGAFKQARKLVVLR